MPTRARAAAASEPPAASARAGELYVVKYAQLQAAREEECGKLKAQVTKLRKALVESHAVLRRLTTQDQALKSELASLDELRHSAEIVNLEYLRNVMVRFLHTVYSKESDSAEQQVSLVRVIETALHFTAAERQAVEQLVQEHVSGGSGWWFT